MKLTKNDLIEIAGLIQTGIVDDYGKGEVQKRIARRLLRKIRYTYRSI